MSTHVPTTSQVLVALFLKPVSKMNNPKFDLHQQITLGHVLTIPLKSYPELTQKKSTLN